MKYAHAPFRRQLRTTRLRQGLSQEDLATRSGHEGCTISRFETGKQSPLVPSLCRLADALGVTTDHLLGRDPGERA